MKNLSRVLRSLIHPKEYNKAPRLPNGRFQCPEHWGFALPSKCPGTLPKIPPDDILNLHLPVIKPDFTPPTEDKCKLTWLGHASVLLQVNGFNVLTDPVYSERVSPVSFAGPKRYRPPPCSVEDLPPLSAVLISHNHYDHLDMATISQISKKYPEVKWFTPLENAKFLQSADVDIKQIVELDWWQSQDISFEGSRFKVTCVPAQHWSKRTLFDTNKSLWGGFIVSGLEGSFYFAGDTGYSPVFHAIGNRFGKQSISAIPIGAYQPRSVMSPQHIDPIEAIKIHKEVFSCHSVGIHWGTFVLTDEDYLEPREMLENEDSFSAVNPGESCVVPWKL
ncbi:beta-lactamase superfamily domain-containing protein [Globomyces pollinis-pini]|nr:beta-lactamase superfamily domain-containing protein [Globomyces pollinis-pini]